MLLPILKCVEVWLRMRILLHKIFCSYCSFTRCYGEALEMVSKKEHDSYHECSLSSVGGVVQGQVDPFPHVRGRTVQMTMCLSPPSFRT